LPFRILPTSGEFDVEETDKIDLTEYLFN